MTTTQTRYAYDTEVNVKIVAVWCGECGVPFGLAKSFIDARREDHKTWYCPNGHSRWYPPGSSPEEKKIERLERELEASRSLAQRESSRRVSAENRATSAERRRAAAKGQLTKTKRRIANGVCPCCNRSFKNLAGHMAGQHPDYVQSTTNQKENQ